MPIVLAPLAGFVLGALLSWGAPPASAQSAAARKRGEHAVAAFAALVFAPMLATFLVVAPDWAYAYLVDSRRVPSALEVAFVGASALAVVGGYRALRARDPRDPGRLVTGLLLVFAPLVLVLSGAALLGDRLATDATFAEWKGDFGADPVAGGWLGWALVWADGLVVVGGAVALRGLRGHRGPGAGEDDPRGGHPAPARRAVGRPGLARGAGRRAP